MSERPIFIPTLNDIKLVETIMVEFNWFSGFSKVQKQKSIRSLHEEAKKTNNIENILEISTKSEKTIGVKASAFNMIINLKNKQSASVESFYQGSKIFENGGPYIDLYKKSSLESKKDGRLQLSGNLKGFKFQDENWGIDENFYDWLYLNALIQNKDIANEINKYDAFTDIEFNPKKSYNCQAHTAALFKALLARNFDLNNIRSPSNFKKHFPKEQLLNTQLDLF